MKFIHNYDTDGVLLENLGKITLDIYKMIYFYEKEYIRKEYLSIFDEDTLIDIKEKKEEHLEKLIHLFSIVNVVFNKRTSSSEKKSLIKYFLRNIKVEMEIIEDFEILDNIGFEDWLKVNIINTHLNNNIQKIKE